MVKTNMVVQDSGCYVQVDGVVYYVKTAFNSINAKPGTLIYPYMAVNTGSPINATECLLGCSLDPWRPCVIDVTHGTYISYGNNLRYNDPINTSFSGLGTPAIEMPSSGNLMLHFAAVDKDNMPIKEGLTFQISQAPAGRTQNTCDPYWARYHLDTSPSGAGTSVDGTWKGTTPFDVCMPIGIRSIKFSKSGYLDKTISIQVLSSEANADMIVNPAGSPWKLDIAPPPRVCDENATRCKTGTTIKQQCQNNAWVDTNQTALECGYIGAAPCRELIPEIVRIDPLTVSPGSTASVWIKVHNPSSAPSNPCRVKITCTGGDTSWIGTTVDIPGISAQAYSPEIRGAYTATQSAKGTVTLCANIETFFGI